MSTTKDIAKDIAQSFATGFSARLYVGPEQYQYQEAALQAAKILEDLGVEAKVINWNRLAGFFNGQSETLPPGDKTNIPEIAWNLMIKSVKQIAAATQAGKLPKVDLPFDPADDIICVIHDFDGVLEQHNKNGQLITFLRTYISGNMGMAYDGGDDEDPKSRRGRRLFVLLSVNRDIGPFLPELSPIHVSLPGPDASRRAIDNVLNPLIAAHEAKESEGIAKPSDATYDSLVMALAGMPYQDREDAMSQAINVHRLSIAKHKAIDEIVGDLCATIDDEKSRFIQGKPGLVYVPKKSLPTNSLPGYEAVQEWVQKSIHADPALARKHNLPPARGILLVGVQGTGKTEFAKALSRQANRILISMSPGEIQGGLVGQSENQMRAALEIIRQTKPVVFVDEIDKMGMSSIQGGHQGDGGTYSRMIGMLLTEMTDPANEAIWVMAANRLVSVDGTVLLPAPLIRDGRIDERYWVDVPDQPIRRLILDVHMNKHSIKADNPAALDEVAEMTNNWVGAELAAMVVKGVREAIFQRKDVISTAWMKLYASSKTPLAAQPAFQSELEANRKACDRFIQVGRSGKSETTSAITRPGNARSARTISM